MLPREYALHSVCDQCEIEVYEHPAVLHVREGYKLAAWICPGCGNTNFTLVDVQTNPAERISVSAI